MIGCLCVLVVVFFFKQKTAYEMRISDWSSDVCSSDLTGLLAFAALRLWPHSLATASDIDAVCLPVVEENAALNRVAMGARAGELTMVIAPGMDDPLLQARGPYDLLIANILAAPLVELAADFARSEERRGGKEWFSTCKSRGSPSH